MKLILPVSILLAPCAFAVVTIDYVNVSNAGNAADTSGYGAVAYEYKIGKNETTLAQYAEFLNATAATDSYGLYDARMASVGYIAGISRSGSSGGYTYSVIGSGNRPITYVSWFDAARFVNWMHNGQGNGSSETGVYSLNGATSGIFIAQPGATVWLPTEDEWYKAAYYDPTKNSGTGGYWLYPTQSDAISGNTVGASTSANYWDGDYVGGGTFPLPSGNNQLTDVGAYGTNSAGYYGTNDQGGNVQEWNDAVIGLSRGVRGGSWDIDGAFLQSQYRLDEDPANQNALVGFRVASVPEPSAMVLTVLFSGVMLVRRKR